MNFNKAEVGMETVKQLFQLYWVNVGASEAVRNRINLTQFFEYFTGYADRIDRYFLHYFLYNVTLILRHFT